MYKERAGRAAHNKIRGTRVIFYFFQTNVYFILTDIFYQTLILCDQLQCYYYTTMFQDEIQVSFKYDLIGEGVFCFHHDRHNANSKF